MTRRGITRYASWTILVSIILFSPRLSDARDLSRYRAFSLGTSLADLSKQIDQRAIDATTVHEGPALVQEMTWWPSSSLSAHGGGEAIRQVRFSFYNEVLYKMVVSYDAFSTRGLTPEDIERSLALQYGSPSTRAGEIRNRYGRAENVLARWEDSQYSFNLFRSSLSNHLGLVVFTKLLNAKAEVLATQAADLKVREAPGKERARVKAEADALNAVRHENLKAFHP